MRVEPTGTQCSEYPLVIGRQDKVATVVFQTHVPYLCRAIRLVYE